MKLPKRQQQVFDLLIDGKSVKEIAYDLNLEDSTVKLHLRCIYKKYGVRNMRELFVKLLKEKNNDCAA